MDFRQLETFVEVAKLKSFSRAATKLYITQPTVTNHIKNLEMELGTMLFNRLGKNISLTDTGNLLYKYAINILNYREMAKFDLASFQGKIQGHLQIYSSSIPRKYMLPNILKSFLSTYPHITFTIGSKDSKEVVQGILDGETDFGILGARFPSNNLEYIELMEDSLVLVTPYNHDYPEENFSYVNKDVLLKDGILFREEGSGTRTLVENVIESMGINKEKLNIIGYIQDTETIKELISLGVGVSILSVKAVEKDLALKKYKAFYVNGGNFNRKFYFAFHKNRQLSPLSEAFKNHVLNYVED